jgi:hypothetical protein
MTTTAKTMTGQVRPGAEDLLRELAHFTGDLERYRHWTGRPIYTPGVRHLAERAGAYWLIDLISSWIDHETLKGEDFIVWTLTVNADRGARAIAEDGNGRELVRQEIAFTDFPLDEIALYLTDGTLLLPGEY